MTRAALFGEERLTLRGGAHDDIAATGVAAGGAPCARPWASTLWM
jgi:hypothetical protein